MAENFNPNQFRQQMAQQAGKIPALVNVTQPQAAPQIQGRPQAPAPVPQQYAPQPPVPQQPVPQQHVPQQHVQQQPVPQYVPQQQPAQHQTQPQHAAHPQAAQQGRHPQSGQFEPQFQPQPQQGYALPPQHMMPEGEIKTPKVKRSLFKRKKLKPTAAPTAPQMPELPQLSQISGHMPQMPQVPQMPQMPKVPEQIGSALNVLPTAAGIARPIVFAAGLALGVFGMMLGNMLFSSGDKQSVKSASTVSQLSSEMPISEGSALEGSTQMALTDEMLLNSKNGEP